jgi:kynurenine--oxoglutarate transaminase/cysteine-S-conjugate beta-lyase/glutamine--phenylpyruvate transaminase
MKFLDQPDKCYFYSLAKELQPKRDMLTKICQEAGLSPVVPEGGYFMMVNTAGLSKYDH